tara:strand:- start:589 stop:1158 length:570 start_codon:yes stop_codon:yes gene_type:complete
MIRIGIVGDIGCGKTFVANKFGYPVFNADQEVGRLYKYDKICFKKLRKILPNNILSFPITKRQIISAILENNYNLKKIIKIIHPLIRKKMRKFLSKNKGKKIVVLDIPLLLENNIYNKNDIIVFVDSRKNKITKMLKKRKNFNPDLINRFKKIQLSLEYKKKKSHFIIRNNFSKKYLKKDINKILKKII